jgi:simple sugar transport system ATP-binding protein
VLRNGDLIGEYPVKDLPRVALIEKMLGRDMQQMLSNVHNEVRDFGAAIPVVEAEGLVSAS